MKPKRMLLYSALFLLTVILAPFTVLAQNGLTSQQLTTIKTVGSVYISADGKYAAYTLSVPVDPFKENALPKTHLYTLDLESGDSSPIDTAGIVGAVSFRPQHNTLTYLAKKEEDETTSLYEISEDGEANKIFSFETNIAAYSFAPDGNHIVFMANEPTEERESVLPYSPEIYEENFSNRRAYVQNLNQEGHKPHVLNIQGTVYDAAFSPDMSKIALAVAPTPHVDDFYMRQKVVIVDHHSGEVISELDHEGKLGAFSWSPDGTAIALIAAHSINDPHAGRLKIADAESGETTRIDEGFKGAIDQVKWIDNSSLYYLASVGTEAEFGRINADNGNREVILKEDGLILKSFAAARNQVYLFDASTATHPDEVYLLENGASGPRRITNHNQWLDNVAMGKQESFKYEARDGKELEGILIYPVGYEDGERYPLITVVHGGPESHYDNGWNTNYSTPGQVAAAQGYVVFYPNYRGSTGRGLEFAMSSQGDLAGAEFDDIVDGVDYLIEQGIADEDKVGVTGGSYGGYATAWMSTYYSERFAAGVMSVGISNNISKWGTSDIPEELYHVHARKRIWDDYQDYLERSPIYYVDQAQTPLLIMHGKEDTRVNPGQSYELYRHIKTRTDTPVRLVLYPGEGHGNRRSTAQFDFNLRMMQWFNNYLKGEGDSERPDTELDVPARSIGN